MQSLMGGGGGAEHYDAEKALVARRQILAMRDDRISKEKARAEEPLLQKQK